VGSHACEISLPAISQREGSFYFIFFLNGEIMNNQGVSADFGSELSSFIRRINTFNSYARSAQFGPDAKRLRSVKRRGISPATLKAAGSPTQDGKADAAPCPGSIQRLCTPTSRSRPRTVVPEASPPIAETRPNKVSTKTAPCVLVTDGEEIYEVVVLMPDIVRSSDGMRDSDLIASWTQLFGPKGKFFEVSPDHQLDRLRSYLSALPKRKVQDAIFSVRFTLMSRGLPKLKSITIRALLSLNSPHERTWTDVRLRLRPVLQAVDSR
jgi:hypothetical protein